MADTVTTQYVHKLAITDGNTLAVYPWELTLPFPLSLTDAQVTAITQVIAGALPANEYGWKVTAEIDTTTTTVSVDNHPYPEVDIPPTPPAP